MEACLLYTSQYAIQGYKVNALDYILKPISYFSFSESMVRALAKVKAPEKEYITIVLKGGKKKLDVARICYVEVQNHVLIYHTLDAVSYTHLDVYKRQGWICGLYI